jgi:hypothetical protein
MDLQFYILTILFSLIAAAPIAVFMGLVFGGIGI